MLFWLGNLINSATLSGQINSSKVASKTIFSSAGNVCFAHGDRVDFSMTKNQMPNACVLSE